ncbi:peptidase M3 [Candidatus Marinamargulisbacteria bacterium SCGC AG-343-D04]|nr:peptidase M3 [Candidatus Marinamargulisbacteria bacterium SCGC AG-343-D04]
MTSDCKNVHWDLSDLYSSEKDPSIQKDLNKCTEKAKNFQKKYKNKLNSCTSKEITQAFKELETLFNPLYKVSQYASLRYSIETQNDTLKALCSHIDDIESEISNLTLFFSLELGKLSKEKVNALTKDPCLKNYHYNILREHQTAKYNLSEEEEKIINLKDVTGMNGYQNLYGELTASFSFEITIDGKKKTLTGPEIRNLRYHHDQKVRQNAMEIFFSTYKENKIVVTHLFNHIFKDYNTERKLRGYKHPMSIRNISNDLPDKAVDTLHDVTTKSNTLVQRYYKLKKKLLKLKKMTLADIYAPLPDHKKTFSYKESKSIVLDSFYAFDKEFGDIANMMFEENRIHAPVLKGKRGGAFCSGYTPDINPYVMLNFLGKPRDISTMSHELGHAIHDVLASKQSLFNYHPILPLAETASVFSEMITTDFLLKNITDKQTKIIMLCEKLEDTFATSHRQNMFSEFEKAIHAKSSEGLLSADDFCATYKTLLKQVFKDSVEITDEYQWEWATIPHFVDYPFYVHAYNFGNLLVFSLYQQYLEQGISFIPKLKECLAAGSSDNPQKIAKIVDADITDQKFWNKSIIYIEGMINELETLLSS